MELYIQNEQSLLEDPRGIAEDVIDRTAFKLLRDGPASLLVIYLHGASGTLGSSWRPPSYRAMSAGALDRRHTVAIDYRGFGSSTGVPSEDGLLIDALTLADWAMKMAGIAPSRIVLFRQSIGTAVAVSLAHHLASRPEPALFSGMVLVAPFADVELLAATYRLAGTVPLLSPVARIPRLLTFLNTLICSKWPAKEKIAELVRRCEDLPGNGPNCHISLIHAEDDYDIPWLLCDQVLWHAANASFPGGIMYEELEKEKRKVRVERGAGGWVVERRTEKSVVREEIVKYGLYDRIMSYPVVSLAILRAFGSGM